MKVDLSTLLLIAACALVTFVPRVVPFVIVRNLVLPPALMKWLSYIPVCLLTALIVQGVVEETGSVPSIHWSNLMALLPTLFVALRTKSLLGTVVTGMISAALVRWFLSAY